MKNKHELGSKHYYTKNITKYEYLGPHPRIMDRFFYINLTTEEVEMFMAADLMSLVPTELEALKEYSEILQREQNIILGQIEEIEHKVQNTVKYKLQKELNVPDESFLNIMSDLMILHTDEIQEWLEKNYEGFTTDMVYNATVEIQEWYGKKFIGLPRAYQEFFF